MHTINRFADYDPGMEIIVVLPERQLTLWKDLCEKYQFPISHVTVKGGETRFHSVRNGLDATSESTLIAVHDGVRPLVSRDTLDRCFTRAAEKGIAIPVLPANESLREGMMERSVAVNRSRFFMVQTPQVFDGKLIREAYLQSWSPEFTDDASVVEKNGHPVQMVLGNRENIKITHPEDLLIAELLLDSINRK